MIIVKTDLFKYTKKTLIPITKIVKQTDFNNIVVFLIF